MRNETTSRWQKSAMAAMAGLLLAALVVTAAPSLAQRGWGGHDQGWVRYEQEGGCIGGDRCERNGERLRVPLYDDAVYGVRFHAHDDVGSRSRGHLRVLIDARVIAYDIDVAKSGEVYEVAVQGMHGRYLEFEALYNDEVVVADIEVWYGRGYRPPGDHPGGGYGRPGHDDHPGYDDRPGYGSSGPGSPGWDNSWRRYRQEGCIGGVRCDELQSLRVPLESAPVTAIRFYAHDDVGDRSDGFLRVRIDDAILEYRLDIAKRGDTYEIPVRGLRGRTLIFETATDDEVVVRDIAVRYQAGYSSGGDSGWQPGTSQRPPSYGSSRGWTSYDRYGGCFGGARCDDRGAQIRVPLEDQPVLEIRFYTHDDVGDKSRGHLRVSIDSWTLLEDLDVPKEGDVFVLDADGLRGRALTFETVSDDEIVVQHIEVRYGRLTRR